MVDENVVSIKISPKDLQLILDAQKVINDTLKPYLIALTPEERQSKLKMGDKSNTFVEKVTEYVKSNPEFVPVYMKVANLETDYKAVNDLTLIYRPTEQIASSLSDTILLSGSEAFSNALTYYNSVKQAAKQNVPNAKTIYDDLKKRFDKMKTKKAESAELVKSNYDFMP